MSGEIEVQGPQAPGPFPSPQHPFHEELQADGAGLPAPPIEDAILNRAENAEDQGADANREQAGNGAVQEGVRQEPSAGSAAHLRGEGGVSTPEAAAPEAREDNPGNAASVASGPGPGEPQLMPPPQLPSPMSAQPGAPGPPGLLAPRPLVQQGAMAAPMQMQGTGPGRGALRPPGGVRPVLVKGAPVGRGMGPGPRGPGPPPPRGVAPVMGVGRGAPGGPGGRGEGGQGAKPQAPGAGRGQQGAPAGRGIAPGPKGPAPMAQGVPMGAQGQFIQPPHGYMQPYPHVYHYPGPVMHPAHFQGGQPSSHMLPPPPLHLSSPGGKHGNSQASPSGAQKGVSKQMGGGEKASGGVRGGGALQAVAIAPAPAPPQVVRPAPPPRYTSQGKKPLGRPPKQGAGAQARLAPKGVQRVLQPVGVPVKQVVAPTKVGPGPPLAVKAGLPSVPGASPVGRAPSPSNSGGKGGPARKISCEDIQLVQNLIERCLQLYMNQREVIQTLNFQAKIEPGFTSLVWQKLEEQNPAFFQAYYVRLKVKEQITLFNHLLDQHVHLMHKLRNYSGPPHKQPHALPPPPHMHPMGPPPPHGVPVYPRPPAPGVPLHGPMPGLHPPGMLNGGAHMAMGPPPGPPGPFVPQPGGTPGSMALGSPLPSSGSPLPNGLGPGSSPGSLPPSSADAAPAFEPFAGINMNGPPDMPMEASFMSPEAHPPVHHEEPHSAEGGTLAHEDTGIGMKPSESLGALGHLPRNFSLSDLTGAAELGGNNMSLNDGQLGLLGSLSGSPLVFSPDSAEAFLRSPDRNLDPGDDDFLDDMTNTDDPLDFDKLR